MNNGIRKYADDLISPAVDVLLPNRNRITESTKTLFDYI